MRRGMIL